MTDQRYISAKLGEFSLDEDKIDDAILALLCLGRHAEHRAWKGFDWDSMERLHEKGFISDPIGKARSVWLTDDGLERSEQLLQQLFGKPPDQS